MSLAPSRLVFLRHVLANRARFDHEYTPWSRVVQDTGLSHIGVKRIVKDLAGRGVIRVEFDQLHRRGSRVYVREEYARALIALGNKPTQGDPTWPRPSGDLTDLTTTHKHDPTAPTAPTDPPPLRIEGLREIHPSEDEPGERLLRLSDETFAQHWPDLFAIGFGSDQIRRVVKSRRAVGKSNNRLMEGLDYADYAMRELRERQEQLIDKTGRLVEDLVGYVFNSLCPNGCYRRPPGYISPTEQEEMEAAEEAQRILKARKKREEAEFQVWCGSLAPEERKAILEKGPPGPPEQTLKVAWGKMKVEANTRQVRPSTPPAGMDQGLGKQP